MESVCRLALLISLGCGSPPHAAIDAVAPPVDARPRPPAPMMGANVTATGVTFRVWAPHAHAAYVGGDVSAMMQPEGDGVFRLDSTAAHAGSLYHYEFDTDGGHLSRIDPYCRELAGADCRVVDPAAYAWHDDGFVAAPRETSIVYELHVGSVGGFAGARARLADLADLGVTAIELLPIDSFGGGPASWGYNPQLYFAPKASYGTTDELRALVDEAHQKGIAVWIDFVANHCDGYRRGPLVCFDGTCPDSPWGIYFFPPGTYATTPWGPRPNYPEPRVAQMLRDSVAAWLGEFHGDGFRWDSVSNIRAIDGNGTTPGGKELLTSANDLVHTYGGLSVAEDLKGYGAITEATTGGGFGFDAQWDGFGYAITNVIVAPSDDGRDMGAVESVLHGDFTHLMWSENHDSVGNGGARLPVRIDGANPESFAARRRSMLAAALLLTAPGIPMLFMGQEFLATTAFTDPPIALPSPTTAGAAVRSFYQDLIALRKGLTDPAIQVLHRNDANKVIAYRRGSLIIVANLRNRAYARYDIGVPTSGTLAVKVDADWTRYGADFGGGTTGSIATLAQPKDNQPFTLPVPLPAYGVLVLSY